MRDFRTLDVWVKSHALVLRLYQATAGFPAEERYGLTSQMRRAGVSVPTNIAEGCGHASDPEFARYLQLATASASELEYELLLARDLNYLNVEYYSELTGSVQELKKMLSVFILRIRDRIKG
jgi:four helix bundle protein